MPSRMRGGKGLWTRKKRERDKVIVRNLPPGIAENKFWQSVAPWVRRKTDCEPGEENVDYTSFVPGVASSRFLDSSALLAFFSGFDGHAFADEKVEYSPVQLIPSTRQAKDPLNNSIEQTGLNEASTEPTPPTPAPTMESTPLLDYLQEASRRKKDTGQDTKTKPKSKAKPDMDKVTILQRTDTKQPKQSVAAASQSLGASSAKTKKKKNIATSSTPAGSQQDKAPATDTSSAKKAPKKDKAKKHPTKTSQEPKTEITQTPQILAPPKILTKSNIETGASLTQIDANTDADASAEAKASSNTAPSPASGSRRGRGRGRGRGQPRKAT